MIVEWEHLKRSMVFHRGLLETKMEEIPEVTKIGTIRKEAK